MNDEETPCYIARKPCGCIVMACVDDGAYPKETAREVKDAIKRGFTIERVTVGWVRENGMSRCPAHPRPGHAVQARVQAALGGLGS